MRHPFLFAALIIVAALGMTYLVTAEAKFTATGEHRDDTIAAAFWIPMTVVSLGLAIREAGKR